VSASASRYQQHSDAEKAHSLMSLVVHNIAKTAQEIGIPRTTLTDWADGRKINAQVTEIHHSGGVVPAAKLEEVINQILDDYLKKFQRLHSSNL
jgi:hypothetical protein